MMNIYKVSRTDMIDWDNYDAFVCVAETDEDARNMHPSDYGDWDEPLFSGWVKCEDKSTLTIEHVGTAHGPARIILSSYCAG